MTLENIQIVVTVISNIYITLSAAGNSSVYRYMHLKTLCLYKKVPILCKRRNYHLYCLRKKISGAAADFPALTSNKCTEGYKQDPLTVLLTHLERSTGLEPPAAAGNSPALRRAPERTP